MSLVLIQQPPNAIAERNVLTVAKSQVAAKSGVHYQVIDEQTGKAPAHMVVKRVGKHLAVEVEGEERLVLKDYFPEGGKEGTAYFDIEQANGETVSLTQASETIGVAEGNDYRLYPSLNNNESGLFAWASDAGGLGTVGLAALGALGVGGLVAAASGGGGSSKAVGWGANVTAPATPNAPTSYNDNVGAVTSQASTAASTDDTTPGLNVGTGLANTPKLYVDGVEVPATYDPVTGTLTPDTALVDGSHNLSFTLTDAAGNESAQSASLAVTVDTTAPDAPTAVIGDSNVNGAQDVSGTGTPGDTVVVTWPDNTTSTGTVAGDGTWLVNVPPTMTTDGPVTVIEKDPAGNVSPPVTGVVSIEVAPMPAVAITGAADDAGTITGNVVNGGVSDDTSLGLSGTLSAALSAGEVVKVYDGATYLGDAVVTGTTWTYSTSGLADAAHSFTAQVMDGAGNAGVTSAAYNVIVDTRAPTATVNITAISPESGVSISDFVTNEQSLRVFLTVTGTVGVGERVQISLDNGVSWSDASLLNGNDYVLDNLGNVLSAGNYTFQARVVNALNNTGAVSRQVVVIDTTVAAPSTALAYDTGGSDNDSLTSNNMVNVNWLEAGASWQYQVDNNGMWVAGTGTSFTLSEGTHSYAVRQTDLAGNVSGPSAPQTYLLDTTAPAVPAMALAGDNGVSATDQLTNNNVVNVSLLEGAAIWEYQVDGGAWLAGTGTRFTLGEGAHSYAVRQTDLAGNVSGPSAPQTYVLDTTAPAVPAMALARDTGGSATDLLTNNNVINVSLLEGTATWEYQVDGSAWLAGTGTSFTLSEGSHSYALRQTDLAGNVSGPSAKQTYVLDTTAPAVPAMALAGDTGVSATDQLTNNNVVNVSLLEGTATWEYQVDGGAWLVGTGTSFTLSEGSHSYAVRQTDLAGNVSGPSAPQTCVLDTTAPGMPILAAITDDGATPSNIAPGGSTDDATPLLRYDLVGTNAVAGDMLLVRDGSAELLRHVLTSSEVSVGQVEISAPTLSSGAHSFTAELVDAAGNTGVSSPASSLTVTAPIAPVTLALQNDTGHADDLLTANSTVVVSGLATGATWEYSIDGVSAWQTGSGTTISGMSGQGLHTVYVRQTDGSGQTSAVQHLQFTLVSDSVLQSDSEVEATLDTGFHWRGGAPGNITYSFPTTADGMDNKNATYMAGFQAITSAQQETMRLAVMTWDDLIPQTFVEITRTGTEAPGYSDIEFGSSTTYTNTATGSYPGIGSVWFNNDKFLPENMAAYRFMAVEHEIGHTLGMAHSGVGSGPVDYYQNVTAYSIMSYYRPHHDYVGLSSPAWDAGTMQADWFREDIPPFGYTAAAQTPMLDDILTIQHIYGVSTTTRTDDTTYGFNSTITGQAAQLYSFTTDRSDSTKNAFPVLTLFDSAGNDTLDLSGWNSSSKISLLSGTYSSTNQMTNNIAIAYNCVIENAIGGGGNDIIVGNEVANILKGGDGNDLLEGKGGNDTLDGGLGMDTARYSGLRSDYTLTQNGSGDWTISDKRISSFNEGTDHLLAIEKISFLDGSLDIMTATPSWTLGTQVI